jgi:hypothetical protein
VTFRLDVVDAFGDQLANASDPPRLHRNSLFAAIAVVAVAVVSLFVSFAGGRSAALAIERSGGFTTIRLEDASAGPQALTDELQAAGLRAHVLLAPATPDAVGTWVEVTSPRVLPADGDPSVHDDYDEQAERSRAAQRLRGVEVRGDVVRVPLGYRYDLTLIAGVTPPPGQPPMYDGDGRLLPFR